MCSSEKKSTKWRSEGGEAGFDVANRSKRFMILQMTRDKDGVNFWKDTGMVAGLKPVGGNSLQSFQGDV